MRSTCVGGWGIHRALVVCILPLAERTMQHSPVSYTLPQKTLYVTGVGKSIKNDIEDIILNYGYLPRLEKLKVRVPFRTCLVIGRSCVLPMYMHLQHCSNCTKARGPTNRNRDD